MKLADHVLSDFEAHVLAEYPKEACGLVVADKYLACTNVADEPLQDFKISAVDYMTAKAQGDITCVLHSHPYAKDAKQMSPPEWPSTRDMESWLGNSHPWGIVATEGDGFTRMVWLDDTNPEPLIGREFIHGVNDCYSVVRDWFRRERGITLKNFARGYGWWDMNKNLYSENFASAGFEEVAVDHIQIGDVLLMKIGGAQVIHHAAVVTGNNEITHHMFHRLSGKDQLSRWARCIAKVVRFNPDLLKENA